MIKIDIKNGEAKVIDFKGQKVAVYKNEKDKIFDVFANCTYEGCVINWNEGQKNWVCPCCGSTYSIEGKVLKGPAIKDLQKAEI